MNKCLHCGYEGTSDCCPNCGHYMTSISNTKSTKKGKTTTLEKEVHEMVNALHKKYDAEKGLRYSIDILMTLLKVFTIIFLICGFVGLLIILLFDNSTRIFGAPFIGCFIAFIIYGGLSCYVLYRFANSNYKFSIADVVWTMFVSVPCAILMMIYKGFEE